MAGCRINIIFGEMLRVLPEANCVEPVRIDRVAAPTLDQTIAHSWLDGISICPVAGLPLGALAKAEPALRDILHRRTTSVANGVQRKSAGRRLVQRTTFVTPSRHRPIEIPQCRGFVQRLS